MPRQFGLGKKYRVASFARQGILSDVYAQADEGVRDVVLAFVQAFRLAVQQRGPRMQALWQELGEIGRAAVLAAYEEHYGNAVEYRYDDAGKFRRFSNHALREALESDALFKASANGLDFLFRSTLDDVAPQWYRLNFGAQPRGADISPSPPMRFLGGSTLPGLRLEGPPSKSFNVPPGIFLSEGYPSTPKLRHWQGEGGGRGQAFYPRALLGWSNQAKNNSSSYLTKHGGVNRRKAAQGTPWVRANRGIQGSGFINAGVDAMSKALPQLLNTLFAEWAEEALHGAYDVSGHQLHLPGGGYLGALAATNLEGLTGVQGEAQTSLQANPQLADRFGASRSFQARPL